MALKNIDASTNADMIGLDNNPTLTLSNVTVGPGLKLDKLMIFGNASVAVSGGAATISSGATGGPALTLTRNQVGNLTVPLLVLSVSGASVPVIQLASSAFTSLVSIVFAASANWAGLGGIRVLNSDGVNWGYIPIIPVASVTAAASS